MNNIEALKKAFEQIGDITIKTPEIKKYVFFVWDNIGDHTKAICAESKEEAEHDLKDYLNEYAYMFEGRPHYRLESVS